MSFAGSGTASILILGYSTEEILWFGILFLLGLVVGSFLNVCIYRLPRDKSVVVPASFCPNCGESIRWYDNIPLFSYLMLGGKCRACKSPISLRYPFVEALTGFLFGFFFCEFVIREGQPFSVYLAYIALSSALIVSSFVDWEFYVIPNQITVWGTALGPLYSLLVPSLHPSADPLRGVEFLGNDRLNAVAASLLGVLVGGGLVFLTALIGGMALRKEAVGMGDVKFMAMVGGVMGWKLTVMIYFLAPFFALAGALPMLWSEKEHKLPYAPFLSMATLAALSLQGPLIRFLDSRLLIFSEVVKVIF